MPRKSGNRFSGDGMRHRQPPGMPRNSANRLSGNGLRRAA